MANFKIGAVELPDPSEFKAIPFLIEKSARLAGGDLIADKITQKHTFTIGWSWMYVDDYEALYDQFISDTMFFTLTYWDRGASRTATVRINSVDGNLTQVRSGTDDVYSNVIAELEEQ